MHIQLTSQVMTVDRTSLPVTMEGAYLILKSAMTIMTVEIIVMKMNVSDGRWEVT